MNFRQRPPLALLALLIALVLLGTGRHASASVTPLGIEELVAVADEIHTVRVESQECFVYEGKIMTRARVEVLETFKGTMTGHTDITYLGGRYRMIGMHADTGMEGTKVGDEAVLFMSYPIRRMPAEARARFDASSPLISSPQLVGGFQGRFALTVFPETVPADSPVPQESLLQTAVIKPRGASATRADGRPAPNVSYTDFAAAIHKLVQEQQELQKGGRATARKIGGVAGEFHVPTRRADNAVLRAFDPLPKLAYMSDTELAAVKARAQQQAAAAAAARAAKEARAIEAAELENQQATEKDANQ